MRATSEDFHVILCDQESELVRAWRTQFRAHPEVEVRLGDLLDVEADFYVSPANSHGWIDGGLDLELRARFTAGDIETRVQAAIAERGGLLPVGQALIVETHDDEVPYLVVAPTMKVPGYVGTSSHAHQAMAAVLEALTKFNALSGEIITSVAVPGLCTEVGGMEPHIAALQMHQVYVEWLDTNRERK